MDSTQTSKHITASQSREVSQESNTSTRTIIVHFMRHAPPIHKITDPPDKSIRDPGITEAGKQGCTIFASTIAPRYMPYVTHIFCSPMSRTIETAYWCFAPFLGSNMKNENQQQFEGKPKPVQIIAYPYLQNLDQGLNGTGQEYEDWCAIFGENGRTEYAGKIDGVFMNKEKDWTVKEEGRWHPDCWKWRVRVIKQEFKKIAEEQGKVKEVVVVTHGSFLRKIIRSAGAKAIELMSYSFDPAKKVFEKLTEEEVEQFRAGHESTLT